MPAPGVLLVNNNLAKDCEFITQDLRRFGIGKLLPIADTIQGGDANYLNF